jgi:hypothetical protein
MPCVTDLIELLKKISMSTDKVHIDVDYDGEKFKWEVPLRNLTASRWSPLHEKHTESEDSYTRGPATETPHNR